MPVIFYQSNFCPECGNRREVTPGKRRWLQQRYFCPSCAAQLGHRWDWLPIVIAVGGLTLGTWLGRRPATLLPAAPPLASPVGATMGMVPVSAQDATAQLKPVPQATTMYRCSARTQKGTACKHLVAVAGQRCFQHQGLPAMRR